MNPSAYMLIPGLPIRTIPEQMEAICRAVCAVHGLEYYLLFKYYSKCTPRFISLPKQEAMYLIKTLIKDQEKPIGKQAPTDEAIANFFGLERSTVSYGVALVKNDLRLAEVKERIATITKLYRMR